jgi:hypothetical protein
VNWRYSLCGLASARAFENALLFGLNDEVPAVLDDRVSVHLPILMFIVACNDKNSDGRQTCGAIPDARVDGLRLINPIEQQRDFFSIWSGMPCQPAASLCCLLRTDS